MCPKFMLANDVQSFYVGTRNGQNDFNTTLNAVSMNPALSIQFSVAGQPNNIEQPEPNGAILSGTFYDNTSRNYLRKIFYRAPSKMPDKNPVELKAIVTPLDGGAPITLSWTIMILAERWSFQHFQALRYKCYEGGTANPKNGVAVDMGVGTGNEQRFHFQAKTLNPQTGQTTAILDGEPFVYYSKTYDGGICDPSYAHADLMWGDDDQTKTKNVKVTFDGKDLKVDYEIDYMNYLGWAIIDNSQGKLLFKKDRMPGTHGAKASFSFPLKRKFRSLYTQPKDQQVMLHTAAGVQVEARE